MFLEGVEYRSDGTCLAVRKSRSNSGCFVSGFGGGRGGDVFFFFNISRKIRIIIKQTAQTINAHDTSFNLRLNLTNY